MVSVHVAIEQGKQFGLDWSNIQGFSFPVDASQFEECDMHAYAECPDVWSWLQMVNMTVTMRMKSSLNWRVV